MKTYEVKIDDYGNTFWYNEKGKLHRENGPAIEWSGGSKRWYINDKLHREDGPAVECASGYKCWYLNDEKYTEQEFNAKMNKSTIIDDLKILAEKHGYILTPKK